MTTTRTAVAASLAVCVLLTFQRSAPAPQVAPRMGPTVQVSASGENIQQIWVYADPADGQHLMICGNFSNAQENATYGYVYASADAGTTWRQALLDDSTRWVTEESCIYGEDGHAYFADSQVDTSTGQPRHNWGHMQLYTSDDHGMSWQRAGRRAEGFVDWTFLAAMPQDQHHASSLLIFGNCATDHVGHLAKERPVVLEADGRARLTAGLIPLSPHSLYGTFSGGSVVLPDRTALFIADTLAASRIDMKAMPTQVHTRLDVFSVSPAPHRFRSRALLRSGYGRYFGYDPAPALVRAPDHGDFPGRLYAAWEEHDWSALRGDSMSELWLGISDDEGYHWTSHRIFPPGDAPPATCAHELPVLSGIRLVVNNQGTLGILWSVNGKQLQFASSTDGGRTFRPGQLVAKQEMGPPSVTDAVPWNEWGLAQFLAVQAGKAQDSFVDQSHLGLSVRMERPQGITEMDLTADAHNIFHGFWASVDHDGNHELLTRTIEAPSDVSATSLRLTSTADVPCASEPDPLTPAMPRKPPTLTVEGREVTSLLDLQVEQLNYTAESHTVTVQVILKNKSESLVRGPLTLFAVGLHSDFGRPIALNATGTQQGQPFWELPEAIPAEGLPPLAHSRPVKLRFQIDQFEAVRPSSDAVATWVRVYSAR